MTDNIQSRRIAPKDATCGRYHGIAGMDRRMNQNKYRTKKYPYFVLFSCRRFTLYFVPRWLLYLPSVFYCCFFALFYFQFCTTPPLFTFYFVLSVFFLFPMCTFFSSVSYVYFLFYITFPLFTFRFPFHLHHPFRYCGTNKKMLFAPANIYINIKNPKKILNKDHLKTVSVVWHVKIA